MPMPPRKPRPSHQLLGNNPGLVLKDSGHGRYFGGRPVGGPFPVSVPPASSSAPSFPVPNLQQGPPFITDTLAACLDVNGTYICTPYSPRCYIIQKVTPNSVTVTPTPSLPLTPNHVTAGGIGQLGISPGGSSGHLGTVNNVQQLTKYNSNGISQCLAGQSSFVNPNPLLASSSSIRSNPYRHLQSVVGSNPPSGIPQRIITSPGKNHSGFSSTDQQNFNSLSSDMAAGSGAAGIMSSKAQMALSNDASVEDGAIQNDLDDQGIRPPVPVQRDDQVSKDIPPDELRQLIAAQLEYYFSPENLSNDKFLVSQMDSDQYVYISTVSNFNLIKKLSSDLDLITDILKESKQVQVHPDGKRVRPISNRTVVILRGIPEFTPVEEIKGLFEKENAPKCNNCEFAFNDSWYLSFDSDDEAVRAHRYLREDVREFKGQPIMARIKSRPTTLLSQGVGVPMKNGFHPSPQHAHSPYVNISTAYVSGAQPGQTNAAVATAPMFPGGQQVNLVSSPVFAIPGAAYANFATQLPWASYYDLNQSMGVYSLNGLPPTASQQQPSPNYPKTTPLTLRHRNPNLPRGPRRPGPGDSHMHNSNGGPSHQYGGNSSTGQHRKSNSTGAPTPLLGMAPTNMPLGVHSQLLTHNHHGHVQNAGSSNISRNGGQGHYGMGPPQQSSVPHVNNHSGDNYHSSNSRPYRGDSRPRSSLSNRGKVTQRHREEDGGYESTQGSASASSSNKANPSTRTGTVAPSPVSPQLIATQVVSNSQQNQGRTNFDLEASAFPPLPGSADSALRNGDTPYEGRLSDVVKGVKNLKVSPGEKEKEDIIVGSAASSASVSEPSLNTSAAYIISMASPTKDVENEIPHPSQFLSTALPASRNKKEFREVGVGSADDSHDTRAPASREYSVIGVRGKETADKSTRTEISEFVQGRIVNTVQTSALLHGDQSGNGTRAGNEPRQTGGNREDAGNYRNKPAPTLAKSPVAGKRNAPGSQVPPGSPSSTAAGSEVPYSSNQQSLASSPVSSPAKSSPFSVPSGSVSSSSSNSSATPGGVGRGGGSSGAATYVAKTQSDNNIRGGGGASGGNGSSSQSLQKLNTNDKDAFPTPGFVKSNVPMVKPFSGATEHLSKEGNRTDDEKHKLDGIVGCGKKAEDNNCSTEERDGSVRPSYAQVALSYAQVAQSGKEKPPTSTTQVAQPSHSATSVSQNHAGGTGASNASGAHSGHVGEDRRRQFNDAKETRTQFKPHLQQRSNSGTDGPDRDRDRDRDRGERNFRRGGFRPRMSSEHSQDGAGNGGGRSGRGLRSPK